MNAFAMQFLPIGNQIIR